MDQERKSPMTEANLSKGGGGTVGGLAGGSQHKYTSIAGGAQEPTLLTIGRRYHALGLNVIPTGQDKRPARVTPDPASPHLAWDKWKTDRQAPADLAGLPWPQAASLAAICGPVSAGLVCLDFDDKEQAHGQELGPVRAVLGALGLPADYGWLVTTPSGGYHVWLTCPDLALPDGKGKLDRPARAGWDHVELRAQGHYALLPSPGGRYRFLVGGDLPSQAPAMVTPAALLMAYDLVTVAETAAPSPAPATPRASAAPVGRYTRYAQAALDRELDELARTREGARNSQLNRAAYALGQLVGAGALERSDVESLLESTALAIGLDPHETRATVKSGLDAGAKTPRELPEATAPTSWGPALAPALPGQNGTHEAPEEPPRRFSLTDFGNAERLAHGYGQDLRYCHEWGRWLVWTGKRWELDRAGLVQRLAKKTVRAIYAEAASVVDDERRKEIAKWGMRSEAKNRVDAMVSLAESEPEIAVLTEDLDSDPWLLNVANGALDLRTGELRPHKRADLATKQAGAAYDPDARCPLWLAFLDTIMGGNQDLVGFLQHAIGYSLTGDVSEQVLFFAYGTGANGKSTFAETITALLGDYAQKAPRGMLTMRPAGADSVPNDVARLPGARFVVSNEVDEGRRLAEAQVKDLTGGDTLTARFMRAEFFEFKPTHKLWIYGNHKPVVRGTDEGIWRRMRLIPFTVTIPGDKQDRKLCAKLRAELPGILAWAVRGCLDWQAHGLAVPAEVREATAAYRAEMDVLADFLLDRCVMTPTAEVSKTALFNAYQIWCEANRERPLGKIAFGSRLKERGLADGTTGREKTRAWLGVGLLAMAEGESAKSADNADNRGQESEDNGTIYHSRSVIPEILSAVVRVVRAEDDPDDFDEGEI